MDIGEDTAKSMFGNCIADSNSKPLIRTYPVVALSDNMTIILPRILLITKGGNSPGDLLLPISLNPAAEIITDWNASHELKNETFSYVLHNLFNSPIFAIWVSAVIALPVPFRSAVESFALNPDASFADCYMSILLTCKIVLDTLEYCVSQGPTTL